MASRSLPRAAEAQSPADFDDLRERLLGIIHHLQCADGNLCDLQNVPEELQPSAIVLHRATQELDQLHNEFDRWQGEHVIRLKTDADREAQAAESSRGMTPEERERYRASLGLPAADASATANPLMGAVEAQRSRLLNVLGTVQAIRIANAHSDGAPEAEGALELVEDEIQRILNALEGPQLSKCIVAAEKAQP